MKVAILGVPLKTSGNYVNFLNLRKALTDYEFRLVHYGEIKRTVDYEDNADFVNLKPDLLRFSENYETFAFSLLEHIKAKKYDIFIPMNNELALSIIPHLPKYTQVIHIVNSNTDKVYHAVTQHIDYTSKIVCISKRQTHELLKRIPNYSNKIALIPHWHEIHESHNRKANNRTDNQALKIGYLGRLNNGHKGIMLIPRILERISTSYEFEIIGDGKDKVKFFGKLEDKDIRYHHHGVVPNDKIHTIISDWDILLFPSKIEGFGLALIEAMGNRVVPLTNKIKGVTDYIVTNGKDGYVINNNSISAYVKTIEMLGRNSEMLEQMKHNARATVLRRFNPKDLSQKYAQIFLDSQSYNKPATISFEKWSMPIAFKLSLIRRVWLKLREACRKF